MISWSNVGEVVLIARLQATASVDYATDELIGKTIRQSVTVLISHTPEMLTEIL